jgi:hypothetical protein
MKDQEENRRSKKMYAEAQMSVAITNEALSTGETISTSER